MTISVITLFPEIFEKVLSTSILGRASHKGLVKYQIVDLRQFGEGPHKTVDDRPYGGGAGMVLKADILAKAWESITKTDKKTADFHTILTSASGQTFKQATAQKLSQLQNLIIVSGHYEGVDQRFIDLYVDEEISIGDYILTGGELPALVIIDAAVRLIPQVLTKEEATQNESFSQILNGMLEYPQYTRPPVFADLKVPETLKSGNHQEIETWRKEKSLEKTKQVRKDLLD